MFELASTPQEMGEIVLRGIRLGRLAFRRLFTLTSILAFLGLLPTAFLVWGSGETSFDMSDLGALLHRFEGPYGWSALAVTAVGMPFMAILLRRIALAAHAQTEPRDVELRQAVRLWPWMLLALLIYFLAICFGVILLIVPGLILAVSLMFVEFAVVLDGMKPMAALNASHNLVWGHWWRTFGLLLMIYIPLFLAEAIVGAAMGIGAGNAADATVHGRDLFEQAVLEMVFLALFSPFVYSILFNYYHDLKLRKQLR